MRYHFRMWRTLVLSVLFGLGFAVRAEACGPRVEIRFYEDAGGDLFEIVNKSQEEWSLASLVLTLTGSAGRLVFDTADGGLGASMHQPFAAWNGDGEGDVGYQGATPVDDGSEVVALSFTKFGPGKTFTFVVDVDDRLEDAFGQAMVTDAEIAGASGAARMVKAGGEESRVNGVFLTRGVAVLGGGGLCA